MGIKDKERRNEYERRKWKERRDAKLLALGINPEDRPIGGNSGNRGQAILPPQNALPASIRLKRPDETEEEYRTRYNRERVNHWNARNRSHVAKRARGNYQDNIEQYRETRRKWIAENKEKFTKAQRKYFEKNRERKLAALAEWARKNPDKARAARRRWEQNNPEIFQAAIARCRAQILRAAPEWVDWAAVRKIYSKSANHNRTHPDDKWQVDHIVPLNNPDVCGLHVIPNLRIISAVENQKKGNRVNLELVAEEQMAFLRAVGLAVPTM